MPTLLWTQKQDIGPSPRRSFELVYDVARSRVVGFGGQIGQHVAGDTWEWDGETWTQMSDIGPLPRQGQALAYDSARERTVLFGGTKVGGIVTSFLLGDTW